MMQVNATRHCCVGGNLVEVPAFAGMTGNLLEVLVPACAGMTGNLLDHGINYSSSITISGLTGVV